MKQSRNTPQKQLIRDLLYRNYTHPTADEVYEMARKRKPNISKGTVYRNLNQLAESGEIRRILLPVGPDHFDSVSDHHYHFVCRMCHSVVDVKLPYDEQINAAEIQMPDCKVEWHKLILVGLCPHCKQKITE